MAKSEQAFGLTPAARARLYIPLDEDSAVDPMEEFLFGPDSRRSKGTGGIKGTTGIDGSQDPDPDQAG